MSSRGLGFAVQESTLVSVRVRLLCTIGASESYRGPTLHWCESSVSRGNQTLNFSPFPHASNVCGTILSNDAGRQQRATSPGQQRDSKRT